MTSTVPDELMAGEDLLPPDIAKSDRTSWLYRRSRTPSPRRGEDEGGARDRKGHGLVSTRAPPQSFKPNIVDRKNEVSPLIVVEGVWLRGVVFVM